MADRVVAALEQALLAEERRLAKPRAADLPGGEDVLVVAAGPTGIRVSPEKAPSLLSRGSGGAGRTRGVVCPTPSASSSVSVTTQAPSRRCGHWRVPRIRASGPAPTSGWRETCARPGGRTRRSGSSATLGEGHGTVSGLPAGLVGTRRPLPAARGAGETRRVALRRPRELRDGLAGARWTLDRDAYLHYSAPGDAVAGRGGRRPTRGGRHWPKASAGSGTTCAPSADSSRTRSGAARYGSTALPSRSLARVG